ncbi:MAG TPA: SGNH/GDSL hydrolase family protein [Chthoniobacteraceae bacterium]|nr:SGNH/GDSL hydrolase family protein [Chthoniobacteraceae bacterium]
MNPFSIQLASGAAFFEGIAVTAASACALWIFKQPLVRSAARIIALPGIAIAAASSTPQPLWLQAAWAVLAFVCMALFHPGAPLRWKTVAGAVFLILSVVLCLSEARHWKLPVIAVTRQPVYVIGDSISAGIGSREETWPAVLARTAHVEIVNLARPGATLTTAREQAARITTPGALVILEIGGNDMLNEVKPAVFHERLDTLLSGLRAQGDSIAMFELPLLPFHNGIGEAQRDLAEKYRVTLIPKRCMAAIVGMKGGTVDGLHFSQQGHDAFAEIVKGMLAVESDPHKT